MNPRGDKKIGGGSGGESPHKPRVSTSTQHTPRTHRQRDIRSNPPADDKSEEGVATLQIKCDHPPPFVHGYNGGPPVRGRSAAETERRCVPMSPTECFEPAELGYARVGRKVAGNSSKSFKMVIASVSNRAGHRKIQNGFLEIPPPHTLTFPLRECHSKSPIQWLESGEGSPAHFNQSTGRWGSNYRVPCDRDSC